MYHAQTVVPIEYFENFRYSEFKIALCEMYTTVNIYIYFLLCLLTAA
jgi:hypothetical protein